MRSISYFATCASLSLALGMAGCGIAPIRGSGTLSKVKRDVATFDQVAIAGAGTIEIVTGADEQSVEIETDENLMELLQTEVVDGKLSIKFTKSASPTKGLDAKIRVAHLKSLDVAGAYTAKVDNVDEPTLSIKVAGSVEATAKGKATDLTLTAAGAGTFECAELVATHVKVETAGSCEAMVNASESLDVEIAGSGTVKYSGDPKITKKIAGSGSVEKMQ